MNSSNGFSMSAVFDPTKLFSFLAENNYEKSIPLILHGAGIDIKLADGLVPWLKEAVIAIPIENMTAELAYQIGLLFRKYHKSEHYFGESGRISPEQRKYFDIAMNLGSAPAYWVSGIDSTNVEFKYSCFSFCIRCDYAVDKIKKEIEKSTNMFADALRFQIKARENEILFDKLTKQNDELRAHIEASPDGSLYLEAKERFEKQNYE